MMAVLKEIPIISVIFTIFQYLFFVKFLDKTLKYKRLNLVNEIVCTILFIVFSCISYVYLYTFGEWVPNILFLVLCIAYSFIFYPNSLAEGIILSLVYNIFFTFINYVCNSVELLINISSPSWDYILTGVKLVITYLLITKLLTRAIDYKEYTVAPTEFWLLMGFGVFGVLSIIFVNIFSQIIGLICTFGIIVFSYEFKIIKKFENEKNKLKERNEFLEKQDKLVIV